MLAALLALTASLSWGTSDFLAGLQSRRHSAWAVAAVSQPAAMIGALVVVTALGAGPPRFSSLLPPLLAGFVAAAAALCEYQALRLSSMSLVAPIVAGSAVVPFVAGLAGGDRPSVLQVAGAVLAVAGIVLISRSGTDRREVEASPASVQPTAPVRAASRRAPDPARLRALLFALGAALGFGLLLVAFDMGGKGDPYWTVLVARCSSAVAMGFYIGVRRPSLRLPAKALPAIVVVGLLLAAANTSFTVASTHGNLSVVGILGSLYPAVTVGFAAILLRERLRTWQWAAAALILAGVVCLAAG
jgi:drug/metabolite transporter (DMT)-like permease